MNGPTFQRATKLGLERKTYGPPGYRFFWWFLEAEIDGVVAKYRDWAQIEDDWFVAIESAGKEPDVGKIIESERRRRGLYTKGKNK